MMKSFLCKLLLKTFGWKFSGTLHDVNKAVVVAAPHTSNLDFIIGKLAYCMYNIKVSFLIKKELFFFPLGNILRAIGGIPVDRKKKNNIIEQLVHLFKTKDKFLLTITPEGTRSRVERWKRGFYYIALKANVPVILGFINYRTKEIGMGPVFYPSGNEEKDVKIVKNYYKDAAEWARYPEKFSVS